MAGLTRLTCAIATGVGTGAAVLLTYDAVVTGSDVADAVPAGVIGDDTAVFRAAQGLFVGLTDTVTAAWVVALTLFAAAGLRAGKPARQLDTLWAPERAITDAAGGLVGADAGRAALVAAAAVRVRGGATARVV